MNAHTVFNFPLAQLERGRSLRGYGAGGLGKSNGPHMIRRPLSQLLYPGELIAPLGGGSSNLVNKNSSGNPPAAYCIQAVLNGNVVFNFYIIY